MQTTSNNLPVTSLPKGTGSTKAYALADLHASG